MAASGESQASNSLGQDLPAMDESTAKSGTLTNESNNSASSDQSPAANPIENAAQELEQPLSWMLLRWDVFLIGVTVIVAVLGASIPIRNHDIWLHMATGRDLLNGSYSLGADPYAFTAENQYWVNHSWSYDLLTFGLYSTALGGTALMALKVGVVVALVTVLLQASQNSNHLFGLTTCAALASMMFIWLTHDVQQIMYADALTLHWGVLLKTFGLLIFLFVALNPVNWAAARIRRPIVSGLLAVAIVAWLVFDVQVRDTWLLNLYFTDLPVGVHISPGLAGMTVVGLALKAVLLIALVQAWRHHYPKENTLWWPAIVTTAGVIALIPAFSLTPLLFSYLFLALTWLLLERGKNKLGDLNAAQLSGGLSEKLILSGKAYWPVLLIVWLWANMSGWFLLGLAVIALFVMGEMLTVIFGQQEQRQFLLTLALLPAACLICAINPHHVNVFALPSELSVALSTDIVRGDPLFAWRELRPWQEVFLWSGAWLRPVAVGWWLVALLGLLSFLLNWRRHSWPRVLTFFSFFIASLNLALLIPFFIVAAVPIAARNLIEYSRSRLGPTDDLKGTARSWVMVIRPLAALAGLVLLLTVWPGLLQGRPRGLPYWAVEQDEYLAKTAQNIKKWREDEKLPKGMHGLNLATETASYFAWYCPNEKSFFHSRMQMDGKLLREFQKVRAALILPVARSNSAKMGQNPVEVALRKRLDEIGPILAKRRVCYVTVHDDSFALSEVVIRLERERDKWSLIYFSGSTALFGRRSPALPDGAFAALQVGLTSDAFIDISPESKEMNQAPEPWPSVGAIDDYLQPARRPSAKRQEAAACLKIFERKVPTHNFVNQISWHFLKYASAVGRLASAANGLSLVPALAAPGLHFETAKRRPTELDWRLSQFYLESKDRGSVALLYQAIRSAHQAIRDNPRDAHAYLMLGKAFLWLSKDTRERTWANPNRATFFARLQRLRDVQAIAGLKQAVRLQPELAEAHFLLFRIYLNKGYHKDLALQHLQDFLKIRSRRMAGSGSIGTSEDPLVTLRQTAKQLKKEVDKSNSFIKKYARKMLVLPRADLALKQGLAGKALEILLTTNIANFGNEGMKMELSLLMDVGRARDVYYWMKDPPGKSVAATSGEPHVKAEVKFKTNLGPEQYHWLRAQVNAVFGRYRRAAAHLKQMVVPDPKSYLELAAAQPRFATATAGTLAANILFAVQPHPLKYLPVSWKKEESEVAYLHPTMSPFKEFFGVLPNDSFVKQQRAAAAGLQRAAEVGTLLGLLELEAGRTKKAESYFRDVLSIWETEGESSSTSIDFPGRLAAQAWVEAFEIHRQSRQKSRRGP